MYGYEGVLRGGHAGAGHGLVDGSDPVQHVAALGQHGRREAGYKQPREHGRRGEDSLIQYDAVVGCCVDEVPEGRAGRITHDL